MHSVEAESQLRSMPIPKAVKMAGAMDIRGKAQEAWMLALTSKAKAKHSVTGDPRSGDGSDSSTDGASTAEHERASVKPAKAARKKRGVNASSYRPPKEHEASGSAVSADSNDYGGACKVFASTPVDPKGHDSQTKKAERSKTKSSKNSKNAPKDRSRGKEAWGNETFSKKPIQILGKETPQQAKARHAVSRANETREVSGR